MGIKVWGTSDDLIEVEGDIVEEFGFSGDESCALAFSDGTLLEIKYGKGKQGIWHIVPLVKGPLYEKLDVCDDENDDPYSDIAYLKDGVTCVAFAPRFQLAKKEK